MYMSLMKTTRGKLLVSTQKIKRKLSSQITTKNKENKVANNKRRHQEKKRGTNELQNNKTTNKMAIGSPYLLISTLNVKRLNSLIKSIA